jgi:hypothetical protein
VRAAAPGPEASGKGRPAGVLARCWCWVVVGWACPCCCVAGLRQAPGLPGASAASCSGGCLAITRRRVCAAEWCPGPVRCGMRTFDARPRPAAGCVTHPVTVVTVRGARALGVSWSAAAGCSCIYLRILISCLMHTLYPSICCVWVLLASPVLYLWLAGRLGIFLRFPSAWRGPLVFAVSPRPPLRCSAFCSRAYMCCFVPRLVSVAFFSAARGCLCG